MPPLNETDNNQIPWSHVIAASDAGIELQSITIEPNQAQREDLAKHYDVIAIDNISADLKLKRVRGGMVIYVAGAFKADIVQQCVVTLEQMTTHLEDSFEAWYADPDQAVSFSKAKQQRELQRQHGEAPIIPEKDDPEPIINGKLDLGDVVMQFVSLSIDPYPVKEGVERSEKTVPVVNEPAPERKNPFAKLQEWKDKQGKE